MAIADIAEVSVERAEPKGLRMDRRFSREGTHPYDEIEWERRDSAIPGETGNVFEQKGVEVPKVWSQTATNVVASKYFRGKLGSPERESSVKQMVDRVVDTIARAGFEGGYFASAPDRDAFADELKYLMVHQYASFNSPVWFNIGVEGVPQQASACFILSVEDDMHSILDWFRDEGIIFKGGSGSGANVSRIRSQKENLSGGGFASGPVSFMRGADSVAGSIKSGGTTRRAAKMVILDADHPDLHEFIWCKAKEEKKAWALGEAGYDMSLNGEAWQSIQFQNANNSVRVTDEFMKKAQTEEDWSLTARIGGAVLETVKARALLREIAEAAWQSTTRHAISRRSISFVSCTATASSTSNGSARPWRSYSRRRRSSSATPTIRPRRSPRTRARIASSVSATRISARSSCSAVFRTIPTRVGRMPPRSPRS